jgi:prepilin-type N-terminal cleavage/methylation domain-containing protein
MPSTRTSERGFTLIELMMVLAIIGMLASIILATLNYNRFRARDAAIMTSTLQFAKLYEFNVLDHSSYAQLMSGWDGTSANCADSFASSQHVTKARELCSYIVAQQGELGGNRFYTGVAPAFTNTQFFSVMAWLPGAQRYFCVGSSGRTSFTTAGVWNAAGCYNNP